MRIMIPDDAGEEFANTFREWHYLVNGFATGVIVGFFVGVYITWKLLRHEHQ